MASVITRPTAQRSQIAINFDRFAVAGLLETVSVGLRHGYCLRPLRGQWFQERTRQQLN